MKMLRDRQEAVTGGEGRTLVVGVKFDSESRELLTWALMKVAQSGDRVIALHVLSDQDVLDRDGKSCLLSLVKAFDSVLAVYEGFCNLKQVDLKLKICRGSSVKKGIVREAKAYGATQVIVGTSSNYRAVGSSASVAKYCARKLSEDCCVVAVNNAKVVFQREASSVSSSSFRGERCSLRKNLLCAIQRSLSKHHNTRLLKNASAKALPYQETSRDCGLESHNAELGCSDTSLRQTCSICTPGTNLQDPNQNREDCNLDENQNSSLAMVPVQTLEGASSSISLLIREIPELRPGWPLLRRRILPNLQSGESSLKQTSIVQWAMRLPSRFSSVAVYPDCKQITTHQGDDVCDSKLDGESGAIVPVGSDATSPPSSPCFGSKEIPKELEGLHEKYSSTCRLFGYQELLSATCNFNPDNLVGRGGSSQVYRGILPDGKELAVKILKPSENVLKEFVLEIEIITTLHHKNIISLFGFCFEDNHLLLVYDFLSRGSLEDNLHVNRKDNLAFGWTERFKVALGVAEALEYLHAGSTQSVIHRDVKSSNILLSDDFEPQLSDFGLATWASASSHITGTDVAGTFGYLAPEYFMYGKVNDKIDVYAFGVVLLELLSGRKPICSDCPKGQESLVMWAKPILEGGKITQLLDPSFGNNYNRDQMERVVLAATLCIRRSPRSRPRIGLVVKLLQGDPEIIKWVKVEVSAKEEVDAQDEETFPHSNIQSHLNVALLDVEDDSLSVSSIEQSVSLEDYLQGRWSRSSSFD